MLYDVLVRSRPTLMRLGPDRYSSRSLRRQNLTPFAAEATVQGRAPRVECYAVSRQQAPSDVAAMLSLGLGDAVVLRENRYLADGEPVQLGDTYLPTNVVGTSMLATELDLGPGGTFAALERLGYRTARIKEQVTTRFPTRDEAEMLKLLPGAPVIVLLHASIDSDGFPFEVTRYIIRSDVMAFFTWRRSLPDRQRIRRHRLACQRVRPPGFAGNRQTTWRELAGHRQWSAADDAIRVPPRGAAVPGKSCAGSCAGGAP
ncbi:GntR family transcriptional regulator [Solwaraspora sp. WMMB335]|uniref:GntR family transcriptional regulator n=1 Tax=Solwaraspora sp. WMMB335 TaxID=3404118 RepID=UPI003B92F451